MKLSSHFLFRTVAATSAAVVFAVAGGAVATADVISNNLDGTVDAAVESMSLAPATTGTTTLRIITANDDGKNGCNLTGQTTFSATVQSSNTAVATVSPSSVTFTSCNDPKTLTVTAVATGTARISLAPGTNTTGGTFDLAPATFDVVVANKSTPTTTTVTCADVVYTGAAQTPCSATTTGENGFAATPTLAYSANTNAGTVSVTATYIGDATHDPSSKTTTFAIGKAESNTAITCDSAVYTGGALEPCRATATGVGGLSVSVSPTYTNNTEAGTASVTAVYGGDGNHNGSQASQSFTIGQAAATCTITPFSGTYDGAAHGLTGSCTGVDKVDLSSGLSLGDTKTDAGSYDVAWSFDGGKNYANQSGTASVSIARAESSVTVSCPVSVVFDGAGQEPCTAHVTGPGGLDEPVSPKYVGNLHVGTATATATYAGGDNHVPSTGSGRFEITKASTTTVITCTAGPHVYSGDAQTPCSATATGPGLAETSVEVSYGNNTNAGSASAQAVFAGDADHWSSSDAKSFTIDKAPSTVVITCTGPNTYSGAALTPCSAVATGVAMEDVTLTVDYADNVSAGPATASAAWIGDHNHLGDSSATAFTIDKAASTVTLTCPSSVTYDGGKQEPCTADVAGPGDLAATVPVTYTDNVDAGNAHATASFAGDVNHEGDSATATFTIAKATSLTSVTCPDSVIYSGKDQTPCSATATGAGSFSTPVDVTYTSNRDAGTAHASATFGGGVNHEGSSGAKDFTILPAASVVSITCPVSVVYSGVAQTPCTASVTGAGGLSSPLEVSYTGNVAAGTATASATYGGDPNHTGSDDSVTFSIAKAPSTVVVICDSTGAYTGSSIEPCSATAQGVGMAAVPLGVTYANNLDAGSATASASWDGDANNEGSTGSTAFTITQAATVTTVTCTAGPFPYTGSGITPCSATVSGAGMTTTAVPVSYTDNVNPGTATATATYAGDRNHTGSTASATFTIDKWGLKGFYSPVDMGGVYNTVKNGSTVPLKFEVFSGSTELTATSAVKSFTQAKVTCDGTASTDDIEVTTTGGTSLRYDTTAGQFIQNWQTPKTAGSCYRVTMATQDGSSLVAYFKLK